MARSEHLPIYKASYDLCLHLENVVQGFSRHHRYTLGADLRDSARRLCVHYLRPALDQGWKVVWVPQIRRAVQGLRSRWVMRIPLQRAHRPSAKLQR